MAEYLVPMEIDEGFELQDHSFNEFDNKSKQNNTFNWFNILGDISIFWSITRGGPNHQDIHNL